VPADFSIVSTGALALLGIGTLAVVVLLVVGRRRLSRLVLAAGLVVVTLLVGVNVLGWVNRHYAYYRTWDELWGRRAQDAASGSQVRRQATVPSHGEVVQVSIPGTRSGFRAREAQIYLPPAWFAKPRPRLGALVLLAGTPGMTDDWTRSGLADVTSDAYASLHDGEAPVLVMADQNGSDTGDTECIGAAEGYLSTDVPSYVARRYGIPLDPAQWGVAGLSEGGMCGLMLALRHPGTFSTFVDFSGLLGPRSGDGNAVGSTVADLFHGDETAFKAHEPLAIMRDGQFPTLAGWFEVGSLDSDPLVAQRLLVPAARDAAITACAVEAPGGEHTFRFWADAFRDALPWIAARLEGKAVPPCP
jgi:enterochelin esterase-like enzyme